MTGATASVAMPYDWSDVARLQAERQLSEDQCGTAHSLGGASTCSGSKLSRFEVLIVHALMHSIPSDLTRVTVYVPYHQLSAAWEYAHSPHDSILADSHTHTRAVQEAGRMLL